MLKFKNFEIASSALTPEMTHSLLTLGFSTRIKNSTAGLKAGVLGTSKDEKARWSDEEIATEAAAIGLAEWGRDQATADAIADAYEAKMFANIRDGIVTAERTARPRLSDDDKLRRDIAINLLEMAAKAGNWTLPKRTKEREAFDEVLAKALGKATFASKVEAEFKKRKKEQANATDFGLADLFESDAA